ncbi:MAG: PrsW family glutamic-type intramembrane protease [Lachnospiraceae bacterium]|nr:PrsW family glutamic-type intramembrane protease [Lachnospiraceae bacterium]
MNSIIMWGLVPPILLLIYTWRLDKIEREPTGLVIKIFLMGVASTFLAMVLESLAAYGLEFLDLDTTSYVYLAIDNFLAVALIEEFCKRLPVKKFIWNNPNFNFRFDAIVYCLASALGFAAAENIFYMIAYGAGVGLARLIPVHSICAVYMGHYLGAAKTYELDGEVRKKKRCMRLSVLVPTLIHGFWDFALSTEEDLFSYLALGMIVILTVVAFDNLHKYSKEDKPI